MINELTLVVFSIAELQEALKDIIAGKTVEKCFIGDAQKKPDDAIIYKQVMKTTLADLKTTNIPSIDYQEKLEVLGNLYVKGYNINWDILYQNELQQRIPLPTYPFAKDHYWIPSSATEKLIVEKTDIPQLATNAPEAVSKTEIIYYQPVWKPSPAVTTVQTLDGTTVVISNQDSLVSALKTYPKINILQVKSGESYKADKQSYVLNKINRQILLILLKI